MECFRMDQEHLLAHQTDFLSHAADCQNTAATDRCKTTTMKDINHASWNDSHVYVLPYSTGVDEWYKWYFRYHEVMFRQIIQINSHIGMINGID